MKKLLYVLLFLILTIFVVFFINERTYNPLNESDFKLLFKNYNRNLKKDCNINFLGWNSKGEFFDFYSYYSKKNILIDTINYPKINSKWKNSDFTEDSFFSKWKETPVDSLHLIKLNSLLSLGNYNNHKCSNSFSNELNKKGNYYSYIYINELEEYLFLFNVKDNRFYYIRRRGF
ncbi:MAG: hypothetical protein ACWIPJ_09955 [Polaribacter sp.]